jgi:hypothetical protein
MREVPGSSPGKCLFFAFVGLSIVGGFAGSVWGQAASYPIDASMLRAVGALLLHTDKGLIVLLFFFESTML